MIVLALVARGSEILAQVHDDEHQRFLTAAETILSRIPPNSSKLSYAFEDWLFHYVSHDGLVYLAVADTETGRRMPFAFLSEVQKKFLATFDRGLAVQPSTPAETFESFHGTLAALVDQFNRDPDADPVKAAKAELAGVKDIMTQNVEQILSRGERIELLMDRTDMAANQSMAFRRRAVGLRRQMWWKNVKIMALAGVCAVTLMFILFAMFSH
ncbi:uncharacterized protein PFL1_00385 [Pseudozyma flocculosa PF-1]|uniref:Synaptobrevin homolog YKT6 n=1 Tax=Pseudozyma flocculosa TaxID=84751 RepID=A0A5C3ETM2_9BASI|nr:uncharacterized protein PFL1_00385 [Pseudozyma flocculosa PF-1]EPQ32188.1 hypothetical protein PFL1_00385 [Pseudozyma flocculosa PF-1]SPO34867.1 related to vesicle-associated membrane protein 7 [Pseudozyma flocculosa]